MRTLIRIVIAVVAGFFLMWPLGYTWTALSLPTFHLWGLMHGTFVAAWPTLSILTFLALGYFPLFRRIDDTALLIGGLVWGLLLASAFNIRNALGPRVGWLSPRGTEESSSGLAEIMIISQGTRTRLFADLQRQARDGTSQQGAIRLRGRRHRVRTGNRNVGEGRRCGLATNESALYDDTGRSGRMCEGV